jgi:hypothetical protein
MSWLFIWVIFKAQKRPDFDASMFLRNDRGMLAAERLWAFMCFMVHTWYFVTITLQKTVTNVDALTYSGAWGAVALGIHGLDTWRAVRTGQQLPDNPMKPETVHPEEK